MFELTGRVAIITGAAGGLGQAIAVSYATQGAIVVPADLPGISMDKTVEMCKAAKADAEVYAHELDVTKMDSINALVDDVVAKYGKVDILASNAGINKQMPFEETTEDVWDAIIDINLKGSVFMAQACLKVMKENGYGRVIFTSSQAGIVARSGNEPYSASKGGLIAITRALAYDYAPFGITVNTVAPCFAMTELSRKRLENPEFRDMVIGMIPVGRVVNPDEVGAAFTYLSSKEAAMVTGQTLIIDGGWTMW